MQWQGRGWKPLTEDSISFYCCLQHMIKRACWGKVDLCFSIGIIVIEPTSCKGTLQESGHQFRNHGAGEGLHVGTTGFVLNYRSLRSLRKRPASGPSAMNDAAMEQFIEKKAIGCPPVAAGVVEERVRIATNITSTGLSKFMKQPNPFEMVSGLANQSFFPDHWIPAVIKIFTEAAVKRLKETRCEEAKDLAGARQIASLTSRFVPSQTCFEQMHMWVLAADFIRPRCAVDNSAEIRGSKKSVKKLESRIRQILKLSIRAYSVCPGKPEGGECVAIRISTAIDDRSRFVERKNPAWFAVWRPVFITCRSRRFNRGFPSFRKPANERCVTEYKNLTKLDKCPARNLR